MANVVSRKIAWAYFKNFEYYSGLYKRNECVKSMYGPETYGYCNGVDYPKFNKLIASLICYTNKQYYAYKAVDNNSKVGYLSRKQYVKYKNILTKKSKEEAREFLRNNGRMTTMYKLLKRAMDENPNAHWLKTLGYDDTHLEELSRVLQKDARIEFKRVTITEAYNLVLQPNGIGSGQRFCTHSCMYGDPVEPFYSKFQVEAYIAFKGERPIGRFLIWLTSDNQTYVDRLYCNGGEQDDILNAIDVKWENALKYPMESDKDLKIPLIGNINDFNMNLFYPYVDTFSYLAIEDGTLFLHNKNPKNVDSVLLHDACGYGNQKVIKCPKCGKIFLKSKYNNQMNEHYLECEADYDSEKQKEVYLAIYRAFR